MAETAFVILDTNILLHYKQPDQINWLTLCGAERVDLVVSTQLLTEFSDKKDMHPNKQVRERARSRETWIFDRLQRQGEPIRPGVFVLPDGRETRRKVEELDLDSAVNDSAFIALLSIYLDEGRDVRMATADGGMRLKLQLRGLSFLWLDDKYRQETQPDPEKRRADDAERRLRELQTRSPVLDVQGTSQWKVLRQIGLGEKDAYVAQQLELTERSRSTEDEMRARQYGRLPVTIYDAQYRNDLAAIRSMLEQRHHWLTITENAQRITVTVQNTGNQTATEVRLRLRFPEYLTPYGAGGFGQPPLPTHRMPHSPLLPYVPAADMRVDVADVIAMMTTIDGKPSVDRSTGLVTFNWARIQHKEQSTSLDLWVVAHPNAPLGRTSVQTEILCDESGGDNFGRIAVDVLEPTPRAELA